MRWVVGLGGVVGRVEYDTSEEREEEVAEGRRGVRQRESRVGTHRR